MANSALLYADFTAEQCLALTPADAQVACELRHLDAAAAPSIWDAQHYPQLWEPVACLLYNVTLSNQVTPLEAYNQCTIPLRGADAFLFASLALAAAAALFGRLAAVWTLVAGGALGALNHYVNLRHLSSGVALWLAITPADLFFYAFLPPLLVEQALRVDFFMFRRLWAHALLMAFAMVMLSVLAISPFILFVLGFQARGWSWAHGALFAAVVAPTDALAVGAILAKANGPHRLQAIMEGESL
jgi:NhaP-type Na+/H+ or K+/H+ antiporter